MITCDSVTKTYRGVAAVRDATFDVQPGAVTGFIGPNGAGKTTTLKMIVGLAHPDSGTIRVDGLASDRQPWPASFMSVFLSADWLPAKMSPQSLLSYVCRTQNLALSRVGESLSQVGLDHVARRKIGTFSLGMRQRLGIAAATIARPRIMVFDEPVNGLDPDGVLWFRTFIQKQAAEGATVLLSSHQMSELALIVDRVVMIREGEIVANGTAADFTQTAAQPGVFAQTDDVPATQRMLAEHGFDVTTDGDGLCVAGADPAEVSRAIVRANHNLVRVAPLQLTLEQSYFDRLSEPEKAGQS